MKRTDKVTTLEVEAVQLVAGLLRIHDVVIDNKGSSLGVGSDALADLAVLDVSFDMGHRGGEASARATYRMGPYLPKSSKSSSGVTL